MWPGLLFFAVAPFECGLFWEGCLSVFHVEVVARYVSSLECGWAAWRCHKSSAARTGCQSSSAVALQPVASKIRWSLEQYV